jgi:dipeptidyl aminopeptidase/acylaminoacyl peptidase
LVDRCAKSGGTDGQQEEASGGQVSSGKIAFLKIPSPPGSLYRNVHVVNSDGGGQVNLTGIKDGDTDLWIGAWQVAAWSPDGKKMAFTIRPSTNNVNNLDVYVINADGTGKTNLTNTKSVQETYPSWSPDGKRIAYTREGLGSSRHDLYVMNADGTGRTRLAASAAYPSFAPR